MSYRKAKWVSGEELWEVKAQLLRNFMQRRASSSEPTDDEEGSAAHKGLVSGVHPDWMVVDRVIAQRGKGASLEYLAKWCQLSYSETTWEPARHLSQPEDKVSWIDMLHLVLRCVPFFTCPLPSCLLQSADLILCCCISTNGLLARLPRVGCTCC